MFGFGNLFAVACFLPVGYLADRIGRKPLLLAAWWSSTVGAAAFVPLQEWHGAFIGSALYWSGSAGVPVLSAQLASTTPRAALGRALGLVFGAYFLGNIVGAPLAGPAAATLGMRGTIALAVLVFVVSSSLVLGLTASPPIRERARFVVSRTYWTLLVITPFASVLSIVSLVLFPVYLRDVAAIPLERIGIYPGLVSLGAAVLAATSGRIADAFGPIPALVGGATVLTAGAGLIALSGRSEPLIAIAALLLGATQAATPVLAAVVERILPPTRLALGYASYQLAFAVGFGGGGTVAGFLYEADPLLPFLVTVALALPVAALIAAVISRIAPLVAMPGPASAS